MQPTAVLNKSAQEAYRKQDVMTASSVDLNVMLYDALKKNLTLGQRGIAKKNVQTAHKSLMKAQEIITALINSLDMNYQIAEELLSIYEFILRSTEEANVRKDADQITPLIEMVDTLRSAWQQIGESSKGSMYLHEESM